jgi:flagellar basal-body rod protein FlgB
MQIDFGDRKRGLHINTLKKTNRSGVLVLRLLLVKRNRIRIGDDDLGFINEILFRDQLPVAIKKSLDLRSARQNLISSNIANAETPGYKASDIQFESQLKHALNENRIRPKTTDPRHIGGNRSAPIESVQPEIVVDKSPGRLDGNNVQMEAEVVKLNENHLMYSASIQALIKRGSILRSAVLEGRT